jgi:hypothetical protein
VAAIYHKVIYVFALLHVKENLPPQVFQNVFALWSYVYLARSFRNLKEGVIFSYSDVIVMSSLEIYEILFSSNIRYSYASGKFRYTGLIFVLPCGRGDVWMMKVLNEVRKLCLTKHHAMEAYWGVEV